MIFADRVRQNEAVEAEFKRRLAEVAKLDEGTGKYKEK